jgi:fructokinase
MQHRSPSANSRASIGVDVGGTKIEAIVLDEAGSECWRQRVSTPAGDYAATVDTIASLVHQAEAELGLSDCHVGLGTPGSMTAGGLMKNSNSTCLNGRPLQRDIERHLGRPVRIANDANCLALSEATDGAGAGAEVVFAVILGTGTGAGLVVNGHLLEGPNQLAGEWGHNPLPWTQADEVPQPCYCGKSGCIETWVSGPAISADHGRRTGQPLAAVEIGRRAAAGDVDCEASLQRWESRLARALAHVINVLDPHVIVLGGGLSQLERVYTNVPRLWARHVFCGGINESEPVRTRLVRSHHGDSSGVRGAAWLWRG